MKGLLLKDFYTIFKQTKIFLVLILVFSVMPGYNMAAFAVMYASFLPITALAYDERSKWGTLAAMMPYSYRQLFMSKYVLGYCTMAGAAVLAFIVQTFLAAIRHQALSAEEWMTLVVVMCISVILQAILLPVMFKAGVEKGRLVFYGMVGGIVLAGTFLSSRLTNTLENAAELRLSAVLPVLLAVAVAINVISMTVSARIYRTKEV